MHRNAQIPERIGRYEVRAAIGGGGMGDVFRVWDPVRRREVALKVLKFSYPRALHYFKREFRAIARLSHPNLVSLYDLHCEDGRYFYTMELLDGVDIYVYVNGSQLIVEDPHRLADPLRTAKVRASMVQLLGALAYLHDRGRVHRDIKPSNILVSPTGEVHLVDFGIVKELLPGSAGESLSQVFGTATYMSPEQSLGSRVNAASDLYSVGIVLYELLAGRPPFEGDSADVVNQHRRTPPPSLVQRVPGVPPDLALLCMALLAKDPSDRPAAREGLEMIGAPIADPLVAPEFVGRRAARKTLHGALASVQTGEGRLVVVEGPSGVGKSALIEAFTAECAVYGASVFTGACIQRDHVPGRGLDTVVDRLAEAWRRQTAEALRNLPPARRGALVQAFPFLGELLPAHLQGHPDTRADGALAAGLGLRTLLETLAEKRLLVLVLEHVHLADEVTLDVIEALQMGGDLPPVLLVLTVRPDAVPVGSRVSALMEVLSGHPRVRRLALGPFDADETAALVAQHAPDAPAEVIERVHRETGGLPLFVTEMARHLGAHPGEPPPPLDVLMTAKLDALPTDARRVLAALSLSPFPVAAFTLEVVAALRSDALDEALDVLDGEGLVRAEVTPSGDVSVAIVHARLGDALRRALPDEARRALHRAFAQALQRTGGTAAALAFHWREADEPERAYAIAVELAAIRRDAGDHARAVEFLRLALEAGREAAEADTLRVRLADSLARLGRYQDSADALDPMVHGGRTDRDRWLSRQCELYLMAGDLEAFLERVGQLAPGTPRTSLADLLTPVDPVLAERLLGDDDSPRARLVRVQLLVQQNDERAVRKAAKLLERTVDARTSDEPRLRAAWRMADTAIRRAAGDLNGAAAALAEAMDHDRPHLRHADLLGLRLELVRAELALERGQLGLARAATRQLLMTGRERRLSGFLARVCEVRARVHLEAGELALADQLLDEAEERWPQHPAALPSATLAITRARRQLYGGDAAGAAAALRAIAADPSQRPFLTLRDVHRDRLLLAARAEAVLAVRDWRAGERDRAAAAAEALQELLRALKKALPPPEAWMAVLGALADVVTDQPERAASRLGRLLDRPAEWSDDVLILACASDVLAVARDLVRPGSGETDRRRAASTRREAQAAPGPEATALGTSAAN